MLWRLLAVLLALSAAKAENAREPSRFHVASVFFSDYGAAFYYRLLEVSPAGKDSLVRYVRIGPADIFCRRTIIHATETRIPGRTPEQLVRSFRLCETDPVRLKNTLEKYRLNAGILEAISFGISARCGGHSIILGLPNLEQYDVKRMKAGHPDALRLWDLVSKVLRTAFGRKDPFLERTEAEDLVLQRAGERMIPELLSGNYDGALAAAAEGNVCRWKDASFRILLDPYKGPIPASQAQAGFVPQLLDRDRFRFRHYEPPKYPPLAQQARIQGQVELRLDVDRASGEVLSAAPESGHSLLAPPAVEAAKRWQFEPASLDSGTVTVRIEFALRCE